MGAGGAQTLLAEAGGKLQEQLRVILVRGHEGSPRMVLEQMDREEALVFSKLNLGRFIPSVE